jgi:antitoxin (DNA-binding transcriptional repressor) of toxin-antitoxin stability system
MHRVRCLHPFKLPPGLVRLGLHEANRRFSKAIRAVKGGQEVVLIERGRPMAVISRCPSPTPTECTVRQLEAVGVLQRA